MIGQLRGALVEKRPNLVVLDAGGVGYAVHIPLSTYYGLGDLRSETTLLTYTHVGENVLALYGFLTRREKHFFELLISASGVGPSLALRILSGMSTDDLLAAIQKGDEKQLTRIKGVGTKTAGLIVVELRDKMAALQATEAAPSKGGAGPAGGLESDVASALMNLGYDRRSAEKAVEEARRGAGNAGFEALLKASLQRLTKV